MARLDYDKAELFKVGDLVKFIGFNYTPDYYIDDDSDNMMGIIIEESGYEKRIYYQHVHGCTGYIGLKQKR